MATLDDVLAKMGELDTRLDSVSALIAGLRQQVADAMSGAVLPPVMQEKVDAVFDAAEARVAEIDMALDPPFEPSNQ